MKQAKWNYVITAFIAFGIFLIGLIHGFEAAKKVLMIQGAVSMLYLWARCFKQAWDNGSVEKP